MAGETWLTVGELQKAGVLLVEDGNHGEYRPRRDEFGSNGTAFVRAADMSGGRVDFATCEHINDVALARIRKGVGRPDDILLSHKGTVGKLALVPNDAPPFVCSPQTTFWRVLDEKRLDRRYLYGFMRSHSFQAQLASVQGETDMAPYVSLTSQRGLKIALPNVSQQIAIGRLLGAMDDKIELNRRLAETLNGIARTLFKSWFVDFDPVRAQVENRPTGLSSEISALFPSRFGDDGLPEGWSKRTVYDFADIIYGAPFASSRFNTERRGLPLIRVRDLGSHDPEIYTDEQHRTAHVIHPGDVIVGMDGEFRCHLWRGPSAYLNQRLCHFEPAPNVPTSFVALSLHEPLARFEASAVGTTVIHLGKRDLDTVQFIWPGETVLRAFGNLCDDAMMRAIGALSESRNIASLRDTLLPRLITGDLPVADAEAQISAA